MSKKKGKGSRREITKFKNAMRLKLNRRAERRCLSSLVLVQYLDIFALSSLPMQKVLDARAISNTPWNKRADVTRSNASELAASTPSISLELVHIDPFPLLFLSFSLSLSLSLSLSFSLFRKKSARKSSVT
jgi:hypothetical protein